MKATEVLYETKETGAVLAWLHRDYERSMSWGDRARSIFVAVDCNSEAAREKLVTVIRQHLSEQGGEPEEVGCWVDNFNKLGTKTVTPPKVDKKSDRCIDWVFVADHTLLAATPQWVEEENAERKERNRMAKRKYNGLLKEWKARKRLEKEKARTKSLFAVSELDPEPIVPVLEPKVQRYHSLHFGPVSLTKE